MLEGIRILDLSRILAGPWATQLLADMGAEVIKVERPGCGDDTRSWGPPYAESKDGAVKESAYFLAANRGKRSICVDLSTPQGQKVIRDLASKVDVIVENYKVGTLARYGLDAASLCELNPGLVYCSITGFGQTGPYAQLPGYDLLIQGMGGLMSITGVAEGRDGAGPMKVGVALVDVLTGLHASNAILAALWHRSKSGLGQHIDVALLDCLTSSLANQGLNYLTTGESPVRLGNAHPSIVPYDVFPVRDGHIIVAVGNDSQFRRFAGVLGEPDWQTDPRFGTNVARVENRELLTRLICKQLASRNASEWLELFALSGVPAGPVNSIGDVFADPQVRYREMERSINHPLLGDIPAIASPIRFSGQSAFAAVAPPVLGEATREVLQQLANYSREQIDALVQSGVISDV